MKKSRHAIVPAVYLLLRQEEQVLFARRFQTGYMDGRYSLPAGHLDGGESLEEAMIREAHEELNIEIERHTLRLVHVQSRKSDDYERVDFYFEANNWKGTPRIAEPDKCDDLSWFDVNSLPGTVIEGVGRAVQAALRGEMYSESGWNT